MNSTKSFGFYFISFWFFDFLHCALWSRNEGKHWFLSNFLPNFVSRIYILDEVNLCAIAMVWGCVYSIYFVLQWRFQWKKLRGALQRKDYSRIVSQVDCFSMASCWHFCNFVSQHNAIAGQVVEKTAPKV
jgi:hypothetical protein